MARVIETQNTGGKARMDQSKETLTVALLAIAIVMIFSRIPVGFVVMLWPRFPNLRWPTPHRIMKSVTIVTVLGFLVAATVCVYWGGLDSILLFILFPVALILTPLLLWGLKAQLAAIESRMAGESWSDRR